MTPSEIEEKKKQFFKDICTSELPVAVKQALWWRPELVWNWIEDNCIQKEGESVKTIPYQSCPICLGTGMIPNNGTSTSIFQPCSVCNGNKMIPQYQLPIK